MNPRSPAHRLAHAFPRPYAAAAVLALAAIAATASVAEEAILSQSNPVPEEVSQGEQPPQPGHAQPSALGVGILLGLVVLGFLAFLLTRFAPIRCMFGMSRVSESRMSVNILFASALAAVGLWLMHSLFESLWFYDAGRGIVATFTAHDSPHELMTRLIYVGTALFGGALVSRLFERLAQEQETSRKNEENYRITLNSIGDAVVATDTNGIITGMNPVAERLTAWEREDALGHPLCDVLNIINAQSRESLCCPVTRVLETGEAVGLSNHTVLIARDGTERQIADSAAPIRDERGNTAGVVLVFRDVTEEYEVQRRLRDSEAFLSDVFSSIQDGMSVLNRDLTIRQVNSTMEAWYEDLLPLVGRKCYHCYRGFDEPCQPCPSLRCMESGRAESDVVPGPPGSSVEHIELHAYPMRDAETGEISGAVEFVRDITDRKRVENELRMTNEMRRTVIDTIPQFVFWKDRDSVYQGCNWNFARAAGVGTPEEIVGKTDLDLAWKREEAESFRRDDRRVMDSGQAEYHIVEPQTHADGKQAWLDTNKVPIRDATGQVVGVLGTYEDITERRQAEEELRNLRKYLANIIDSMPSVLIGVDADGVVTQWNSGAERVAGLPRTEAVGKPLDQAFPRLAHEMEQVREAMRTREVRTDPRQSRKEDGEILYEDLTIYPLVANGVEGAVLRLDDITERVRIEEMMVQSEKMLSVGGLAAGMAHEINNPLGGMMQNASVMADRLTNTDLPANLSSAERAGTTMEAISTYMELRKIPSMLDRIRESGERAAEIVHNMLSFARKSESGFSTHDMAGLLDQCVELAGADYDLKKKFDFRQIEIVREFEKDLPAVPCEAGKIQQVFLNILRNGAEAMQEQKEAGGPGPRFVLRIVREPEREMVRIEIEDNGPGMGEATRKRVFEPFFTTKPTDKGTGLGLSVSYFIIVENHGGSMAVETEPGEGATFVVRLPTQRKSS